MTSYKQKFEEQVKVAGDFQRLADQFQNERDQAVKEKKVQVSKARAEAEYWRGKYEGFIDGTRLSKDQPIVEDQDTYMHNIQPPHRMNFDPTRI